MGPLVVRLTSFPSPSRPCLFLILFYFFLPKLTSANLTDIMAERPGNPRHPKTAPFLSISNNDRRLAGYAGFDTVGRMRCWIASNRFWPFYKVYCRLKNEAQRSFGISKVLELFADEDAVENYGLGVGPTKGIFLDEDGELVEPTERWAVIADLLYRIFQLS